MAPAQPDNRDNTSSRLTISMAILVLLILIIIVVAWFTNRVQQQVISRAPVNLRSQRRLEEERCQTRMGNAYLLESVPVMRYSAKLLPKDSTRTSHPPRKQLRSKMSRGKQWIAQAGRAAINKAETSDDSHRTQDKLRSRREEGVLQKQQNAGQSGSHFDSPSCAICTENFVEGENVRILPCGHIYHRHCIDPWLLDLDGTCPLW